MQTVRKHIDKVGFASEATQMGAFYNRLIEKQMDKLQGCRKKARISMNTNWRLAICPHDDYTYVGYHYPLVLEQVKAKTIIIFGVAHKAAQFHLADKLIFDAFDAWQSAYGNIKISPLREKLMSKLPKSSYIIHNEMQQIEHSIEAMLPFLQRQNAAIEILPILVPACKLKKIDKLAELVAKVLAKVATTEGLKWGSDFTLLSTSDAIHYGDKDWGEKSLAPLGVGDKANKKVLQHEQKIITTCFSGELKQKNAFDFYGFTVSPKDYKKYLWTWCGRYAVPTAMLAAFYLNDLLGEKPLNTIPLSYSSSILNTHISVDDLQPMGTTAPANERHWVGYCSVGME